MLGIRRGFRGLNPKYGLDPLDLTRETVKDWHTQGGSILGSSRGPQPLDVMVDFLVAKKVSIMFCIGGTK